MDYGICRIYSPDDGRELGLQGMINDLVMKSDFPTGDKLEKNMIDALEEKDNHHIAQTISAFENNIDQYQEFYQEVNCSLATRSKSKVDSKLPFVNSFNLFINALYREFVPASLNCEARVG